MVWPSICRASADVTHKCGFTVAGSSKYEVKYKINIDLENVRNWLYANRLTLERTRKFIPLPWYKEKGVDGTLPQSFWYVAVFRNDFACSGKPLIFLTRWGIFYGWWHCWRPVTSPTMAATLAVILDRKNGNFFVLETKNITPSTLHDFSHESWKKTLFSLKNGLTTCYLWRHIS